MRVRERKAKPSMYSSDAEACRRPTTARSGLCTRITVGELLYRSNAARTSDSLSP